MPSIPWLRTSGPAGAVLCLSLMSLGLSGCGDSHPRLIFSLSSTLPGASSLAVPASGVRAMTSPPPFPEITSGDGLIFQLHTVVVSVADIRLELGGGLTCEDVREELPEGAGCVQSGDAPSTVTLAGPFSIDLDSGELSQGEKELRIPPGKYRRIDFVLGEGGFKAHTWLKRGGTQSWTMKLTLPEGTALGFEVPYALAVEEGGSLRVTFRQSTWLKDLSLGACIQSGDLPHTDSELLLDAATGECQGVGDTVREILRTEGALGARPF
ncbi:hypothetical protein [Corallococcus sp. CA049B]|uniref:hypothetical protein n=1 Tax=Corallococcus sp. CA049B TaxID=2316730 RepID=UPI0011C41DDC|nr:hypothetical protein [Corallococcus sp. CA049B]